jgi:hypothetical protein
MDALGVRSEKDAKLLRESWFLDRLKEVGIDVLGTRGSIEDLPDEPIYEKEPSIGWPAHYDGLLSQQQKQELLRKQKQESLRKQKQELLRNFLISRESGLSPDNETVDNTTRDLQDHLANLEGSTAVKPGRFDYANF